MVQKSQKPEMYKSMQIMGQLTNLSWWSPEFWTINSTNMSLNPVPCDLEAWLLEVAWVVDEALHTQDFPMWCIESHIFQLRMEGKQSSWQLTVAYMEDHIHFPEESFPHLIIKPRFFKTTQVLPWFLLVAALKFYGEKVSFKRDFLWAKVCVCVCGVFFQLTDMI